MTVNPAGGVTIYIGGEVDNVNAASLSSLEAMTYTEVGEVEDGGQYGDEAAVIEFTALTDGRKRKFKGPRDAGTMTVVCGDDPLDPGQINMLAAQQTKFDYAFKVVLNDARSSSGVPTISYFAAKVGGERRNVGTVTNIVKRTFPLWINTAIFETLPD